MSEILKTQDGSDSLYSNKFKESYHSTFGAIQESKYIFINSAFKAYDKTNISVLEIGFGTGLNALLTLLYAKKLNKIVSYEAIELFPIAKEIIPQLNYANKLNCNQELFTELHNSKHDTTNDINANFKFKLIIDNHVNYKYKSKYDLVYYDAFSPDTQPEMWTKEVLEKIYHSMNSNGVFITYVAKGIIRRRLMQIGFTVEKLQGPPGKRHILRAIKQ